MVKLVPKDGPEACKASAKELLKWAIDQDYETVIVFGFKDEKIHSRCSKNNRTLELIGALAVAQIDLWER